MPEKTKGPIRNAGGVRKLKASTLIFHKRHRKIGKRQSSQCALCTQGMAALVVETPTRLAVVDEEREIRPSDRTDEERPTTRPPDNEFWETLRGGM